MKALVLVLFLCQLIPFILTEMILSSCPFIHRNHEKKWFVIGTILNILISFAFFLLVMKGLFGGNPFEKIRSLLTLNCTFQDIARLGISNLICLLLPAGAALLRSVHTRRHEDTAEKFQKKGTVLLFVSVLLFTAVLALEAASKGAGHISLSGFCRKAAVTDAEDEEDASFVTIRNDGLLAYEVRNLYVSDTEDYLQYCRLDAGTIAPGESMTTIITSDDSLNIKKNGGSVVYLSNATGKVLDTLTIPALQQDEAFVNTPEGWKIVSAAKETIDVSAPVFSAKSGFYENAFDLTLSAEEGMNIYYTLDCSDPTTESVLYTGPIHVYDRSAEANIYRSVRNIRGEYLDYDNPAPEPVDKAFVVRAVAADADGNTSKSVTKTFFVNLDKYADKTVVSLVTDPSNLFDDEKGIYVTGSEYDEWYQRFLEEANTPEEKQAMYETEPSPNYRKRGEEWEREADCELLKGSDIILSQPVGIRIQGASTSGSPLKRFSVYSRSQYSGSKFFDQPVLGDFRTHSFVLREGFLNAFVQTLAEDRAAAVQRSIPVSVFVDGEFWYDTYLQEKYVNAFFSEHYGVNPDNITKEERLLYSNLMESIGEIDTSVEESYAEVSKFMDIQSYIDFICINAYLNNEDMHDEKNVLMWKCAIREGDGYDDGRWRWGLYDMDLLWNYAGRDHTENEPAYAVNTFTLGMAPGWGGDFAIADQELFQKLKPNSTFCRRFVLTFMDLVNTDFKAETVLRKLDEWEEAEEEHYEFFKNRAEYIVPYMAQEFGLHGSRETVTLRSNREGAPIRLNTVTPELTDGTWSGTYFTDYSVTATVNDKGFDHWEITLNGVTSTSEGLSVVVPVTKGGTEIHAVFKQSS